MESPSPTPWISGIFHKKPFSLKSNLRKTPSILCHWTEHWTISLCLTTQSSPFPGPPQSSSSSVFHYDWPLFFFLDAALRLLQIGFLLKNSSKYIFPKQIFRENLTSCDYLNNKFGCQTWTMCWIRTLPFRSCETLDKVLTLSWPPFSHM